MSEVGGDFESFMGPAPKEQDEKSDEIFREQMRQAQKALADLKKEEGKAQSQDDNLAQIIVQFLGQAGNADLFLLISRVVAQDIPSSLILAILALVDERSAKEVAGLLAAGEQTPQEPTKALTIPQQNNFQSLPPEHKARIDSWIKTIHHVSAKIPHRILEHVIIKRKPKPGEIGEIIQEVSPTLIQLATFILRNYLNKFQIQFEFEQIHSFMQTVFVELIKNLSELVQGQKQLEK